MKKETKHNKVKIGLPKIIEILSNFTCEVFKPRITLKIIMQINS